MRKFFLAGLLAIILMLSACGQIGQQAAEEPTSNDISSMLQDALQYLNAGDYDAAILEYTSILKIDSKNVDAYLGLSDAYKGGGQNDKAIETLTKATEILPDNYNFAKHLSELFIELGEKAKAAETIRSFLGNNANHAEAYETVSRMYKEEENWVELANVSEYWLQANPNDAVAAANLGSALVNQGEYQKAEEALKEFLAQNEGTPEITQSLALALIQQDKFDEAMQLMEEEGNLDGIAVAPDESLYIGQRNDAGEADGRGVIYYGSSVKPLTRVYMGDFSKGVRSGWGTAYSRNGIKLEGEWANDLPNGPCVKSWLGSSARLQINYSGGRPGGTVSYTHLDGANYSFDASSGVPPEVEKGENGEIIVAKSRLSDEETMLFFTAEDVSNGNYGNFLQPMVD